MTKTIIPLDVSHGVLFGFDFLHEISKQETSTARFLQKILPGAYRAYRQRMGIEGIYAPAAVAVVAALNPELLTTEPMYGDVETSGGLTSGATVFDRRRVRKEQDNMDVAVEVDAAGVRDVVYRALSLAP